LLFIVTVVLYAIQAGATRPLSRMISRRPSHGAAVLISRRHTFSSSIGCSSSSSDLSTFGIQQQQSFFLAIPRLAAVISRSPASSSSSFSPPRQQMWFLSVRRPVTVGFSTQRPAAVVSAVLRPVAVISRRQVPAAIV